MTIRLTDTQLVILGTAASRDDGAVLPLPDTLRIRGGAITAVLESLLGKRLIAELPAARGIVVWREAEGGETMTLVITDAGLAAIGVEPESAVPVDEIATDAAPDPQAAAIILCAGKPVVKQPKARSGAGKRRNKTDLVLDLLRRAEGAGIPALQAATGWQPHSIRAALTGLRRRGRTITRDNPATARPSTASLAGIDPCRRNWIPTQPGSPIRPPVWMIWTGMA